MAWTYDPDNQPTARQIADLLKAQNLTGHYGDEVFRVSLPPLQPDIRYTETDWDNSYGI